MKIRILSPIFAVLGVLATNFGFIYDFNIILFTLAAALFTASIIIDVKTTPKK